MMVGPSVSGVRLAVARVVGAVRPACEESPMRWVPAFCMLALLLLYGSAAAGERPNILWITSEDNSPDLGCYGDAYAATPVLDALAAQGTRYTRCFSVSGVCAPSRSAIITGMDPCGIGTQHMRIRAVPPPFVKCFPEYLRGAGYWCTNRVKTDYQFEAPLSAWDQNGKQAHWRNRPDAEQPFFSVWNITASHESQVRLPDDAFAARTRKLTPEQRHDPAAAVLPPYYPDTPAVRNNWARYYDVVTAMDHEVGEILKELEDDGLAEDTIVFYYGDHGRGLPRAKRWIYDSGLHVPLLVRFPEKWRPAGHEPGGVNGELVSFVDLGPTVLSLAGVQVPRHMQGRPFLGDRQAPPRQYVHAARDRMDESYEFIRAVRDRRYKYIRNFEPEKPRSQKIWYMEKMPIMKEWRRLHAEGKLNAVQARFFESPKEIEELYDTEADPHEVDNLAGDPALRPVLERMRGELARWMEEVGDLGFVAEADMLEAMRPGGRYAVTQPAEATVLATADGRRLALSCPTPGSSINWRLPGDEPKRWRLYSEPIRLAEPVTVVCNRIGFKDSPPATFAPDLPPGDAPLGHPLEDLRRALANGSSLDRLRAVRTLPAHGAAAEPVLLGLLADGDAAVRGWAALGLGAIPKSDAIVQALTGQLSAADPVVRLRAAMALCRQDAVAKGLPVLRDGLKNDRATIRLLAANYLMLLGDAARPALPQLVDALKDQEPYVQRKAGEIVKELDPDLAAKLKVD